MNLPPPPDLPADLTDRWTLVASRLGELPAGRLTSCPRVAETVSRVAVCSNFALSTLLRQPEDLLSRLTDDGPLSEGLLASRFELLGRSEAEAMAVLRRVRNVEMARIAWRDLAGWSDLEANLADLSTLADCAIEAALGFAETQLESRFGRPLDGEGAPVSLLILAMGKLGGKELNYSSDIDLVFLFPESVTFKDHDRSEPEVYFRRLGQLMIKLLDQVTEDGFVFRVDTRLRPFGSSGPLAMSVPALETYLIQHGRDWERYAYLKARLVTGGRHQNELFDEILTPFVYRRYVDFGVFRGLRQMKVLIAEEVARRDMAANIKLGPGGIREIEFIVQTFQLVRGGQSPALRERSLLQALPQLARMNLLGTDAVDVLEGAYRFLRTLENRLQAMNDQQTHDLPSDPTARSILAYSMGARSGDELAANLSRQRELVEAQFARLVFDERGQFSDGTAAESWGSAWERGDLLEALEAASIGEARAVSSELEALRSEQLYSRMDEISRQRLTAVVSRIIPSLTQYTEPARVLHRVLLVLRAIGRRSAYLALLNENPLALGRLLKLADQSEFLVRQVVEHPLLIDELLDSRIFDAPPSRGELEQALQHTVESRAAGDVESRLEVIRSFQRAALFRIAVADRLEDLPLMKVSDRLTDTAELILEFALDTAWAELVEKFGEPLCGQGSDARTAGFAIIGYGKLGGLELGYGSDLDLVFLHDSSGRHQETAGPNRADNGRFFVRLVQRLIHFLSIQTSSGRLYEVDTRLRPDGRSGLPVPSLDSFVSYQQKRAWVWEHQALLRSRSVAGSAEVRKAFEEVRRDILIHYVDRDNLKREITAMRKRMRDELSLSKAEEFDLKQDPGGLSDIEFLIDYWVLAQAHAFPELVKFPDKVRQLEALETTGLVSAERCARIKNIYLALRESAHELALNEGGRIIRGDSFAAERGWLRSVWAEVLGA